MKNLHPRTKLAAHLATACLAFAPVALAVDPPPDGGYPNQNTAEGEDALFSLSTGADNTALGFEALFDNTIASGNTAVGSQALNHNHGRNNTAVGSQALTNNIRGVHNSALGVGALGSNSSGNDNTAVGFRALSKNLADENTGLGFQALKNNAFGTENTAVGYNVLSNSNGGGNTAVGSRALERDISGYQNTAIGLLAMNANTTGRNNTATGNAALQGNTTGNENTASGFAALASNAGDDNTAIGHRAMEAHGTGNNNIALGSSAGRNLTAGDNNIDIGNQGPGQESNTIRIGTQGTQTATYMAGISGATVAAGVGVIVDTNGHLGTVVSSERFKDEIKPMDRASEAILALKPVTFRYKTALDPKGIPQFGLVAEDVEKINPDLVARDDQGKSYTVRYEAVNAMLLNEFLKEHRKVESLEKAMSDQQKENAAMRAMLKAQAAQLQKVSDQLRAQASAPRVVDNE